MSGYKDTPEYKQFLDRLDGKPKHVPTPDANLDKINAQFMATVNTDRMIDAMRYAAEVAAKVCKFPEVKVRRRDELPEAGQWRVKTYDEKTKEFKYTEPIETIIEVDHLSDTRQRRTMDNLIQTLKSNSGIEAFYDPMRRKHRIWIDRCICNENDVNTIIAVISKERIEFYRFDNISK